MDENYNMDKHDIDLVCTGTGCSRVEAQDAILRSKGDLAKAIMEITNR